MMFQIILIHQKSRKSSPWPKSDVPNSAFSNQGNFQQVLCDKHKMILNFKNSMTSITVIHKALYFSFKSNIIRQKIIDKSDRLKAVVLTLLRTNKNKWCASFRFCQWFHGRFTFLWCLSDTRRACSQSYWWPAWIKPTPDIWQNLAWHVSWCAGKEKS